MSKLTKFFAIAVLTSVSAMSSLVYANTIVTPEICLDQSKKYLPICRVVH